MEVAYRWKQKQEKHCRDKSCQWIKLVEKRVAQFMQLQRVLPSGDFWTTYLELITIRFHATKAALILPMCDRESHKHVAESHWGFSGVFVLCTKSFAAQMLNKKIPRKKSKQVELSNERRKKRSKKEREGVEWFNGIADKHSTSQRWKRILAMYKIHCFRRNIGQLLSSARSIKSLPKIRFALI